MVAEQRHHTRVTPPQNSIKARERSMSTSFDTESSVQALRAEAETNRARLTGTVEDLRAQVTDTATDLKERLSPAAIKAEVTDYVRGSRDQLWHSIERKARENPLQAVAVGAAVAWPALKLMRAMPAPLLLVGAGLLLSRKTGAAQIDLSQAAVRMQERAGAASDMVTDAAGRTTDAARRQLHDAQDYVRDGIDTVMQRTAAATSAMRDQVADAAKGARNAGEGARSAVAGAKSAVTDAAESAIEQGTALAQQARNAVAGTWEQNPLMVAGAGLLLGAVIAAAFPSTDLEDKLLGDASDAVKQQAEGLATRGVDAAEAAAKAAVQNVANAASEQGLSADGLKDLGENLTEKVRAVADRGIDAALGETKPAGTSSRRSGTSTTV